MYKHATQPKSRITSARLFFSDFTATTHFFSTPHTLQAKTDELEQDNDRESTSFVTPEAELSPSNEAAPAPPADDTLGDTSSSSITPAIQAKLTVGATDDPYEHEADAIADRVVNSLEAAGPTPLHHSLPPLQRQFDNEEKGGLLQTKGGTESEVPAGLSEGIEQSQGAGLPLPPATQGSMEAAFGVDFSTVRVHTDSISHEMNQQVNARAFTHGYDIYFNAGEYHPEVPSGKHLLAHELTHVLQQVTGGSFLGIKSQTTPTIQRQERAPETGSAEDTSATRPLPEFGDTVVEPGCPRTSTRLGTLRPDPPCPTSEEELDGSLFLFCRDTDIFASEQERNRLRQFVRQQRADTIFTVHGYASWNGGVTYNLNLSCHRAKRAAREMQNAGVPSHQIRIAMRGRTRMFGPRSSDNRVVLVSPSAAPAATTPETSGTATPQQVVDRAVALITSRGYRLAADAYVYRWTCGRMPTLAEVVKRTTVLLEGQDSRTSINRDPLQQANPRMGHANVPGLREIVLATEVFNEASDPVACAAARIVDMGFHHFVADTLHIDANDQSKVHPAALFLVELAGFAPCMSPEQRDPANPGLILIPARRWWTPPAQDPLAAEPSGCLDQPLPGTIIPPGHRVTAEAAPTFVVSDFSPESGSGPIHPLVDVSRNFIRAASPRHAFAFNGEVTASGNPATIPLYEVGFLQTVVADETVVDFVGGESVRLEIPVPMRDGPPRSLDLPPWYMPPLVTRLGAQGVAGSEMSDSPSTLFPYEFIDPAQLHRGPAVQHGNVVNHARVRTTFHTWLAARRPDAPLDRFNTHFLRGHEVRFTLDVDVVGATATGRYQTTINPTQLTDPTPMQLAGPTPAEISSLWRTTRVSPAPPRAQAGGVTLDEFRQRVRDTATALEPLREALGMTGRLMVRVRVDPATGRLRITTTTHPTVTAEELEGGTVSESARQRFADEMLARLRKDLVLAPMASRDAARVPIPTVLSALPSHRTESTEENPYSPAHGIGLIEAIRQTTELERSAEQLRSHPDVYDPQFWPQVNVRMAREQYCYDHTISTFDISSFCRDESMHTDGCVRPFSSSSYTLSSNPTYREQQLGTETIQSPVALEVITFPIRFVLFTARERPAGSTYNHEMHHLMDCYRLVHNLKDRLARRIRARLMEARRLAAQNPQLANQLLARETLQEMVRQEEAPFAAFFQREFKARGADLHAREASAGGLPPYTVPADWTDFHRVEPQSGRQGSFTSDRCS